MTMCASCHSPLCPNFKEQKLVDASLQPFIGLAKKFVWVFLTMLWKNLNELLANPIYLMYVSLIALQPHTNFGNWLST